MLFIIQQEWYRGIGDKLPSLRIEMEVFFFTKRSKFFFMYITIKNDSIFYHRSHAWTGQGKNI